MKKAHLPTLVFALLLACPLAALSAPGYETSYETFRSPHLDGGFHFVVREGVTTGGDTLATITMANGQKRDIDAGGLYQIALGSRMQFDGVPLSLELNLGFHFDRDDFEDNEAQIRRTPLEGIVHLNLTENLRIGVGTRIVYAASATTTLSGVTDWIRFRDARGSIAEIGYHVSPYGWLALRYVREDYFVESHTSSSATTPIMPPGTLYDGAHLGICLILEN